MTTQQQRTNQSYHATITTLFDLLELANRADTDNAEAWQVGDDARQTLHPAYQGLFGRIYDSIGDIAGYEILDHWIDSAEVELSLANRNA